METQSRGIPQPDSDGNYTSPPLAAIRRVWGDYQQEIASEEDVVTVLQAVADFAQLQVEQLEAQLEAGVSQVENAAFLRILEAFELHHEALELMAEHFEAPEEGLFERGLAIVQEATNELMAGHQMLLDDIEAAGQVNCMFCSAPNPRGTDKCARCGRSLLVPGEARSAISVVNAEGLDNSAGQGQVTQNFALVKGAVEAWRAEQLSSDDLLAQLEQVEENLAGHRASNEEAASRLEEAPPERRQAITAALEQTDVAIAHNLAAIEKMKLAFVKEDDTYLVNGLADLEHASRLTLAAFQALKSANS
ncbi:MAG: hypothetical protein AB7S38_27550 [Vulcanimicrobiota bacterium]